MDLGAASAQEARGDEAVAAIVAGAAQREDAQPEHRTVVLLDRLRDSAAGPLHQVDPRDAMILDGGAVQLAHLRGGDQLHT